MLKEGREEGRDGSEAGIFGIGMWWSLVELREGGREGGKVRGCFLAKTAPCIERDGDDEKPHYNLRKITMG